MSEAADPALPDPRPAPARVLPANLDEPRFGAAPAAPAPAPWTATSALIEDLNQPLDSATEVLRPQGLAALAGVVLEVVLDGLGALLGHLLGHGRH
jgi:hypothetical protein